MMIEMVSLQLVHKVMLGYASASVLDLSGRAERAASRYTVSLLNPHFPLRFYARAPSRLGKFLLTVFDQGW